MPPSSPRLLCAICVLAGSLSGCTTTPVTIDQRSVSLPDAAPQQMQESIPVVRQGRYTLVELVPEPAQRDLMQQVVEIFIPPKLDANVGDAMRHVLMRTGYRLCETADAMVLYGLPLPAAHLRLGPLGLRDALLTLAGPAWVLSVDDVSRQVCFQRHTTPTSASSIAVPTGTVPGADRDRVEAAEPREVQP